MANTDEPLNNLLKKSQEHQSFLPDELSYLISSFTPTQEPSTRSKGYLVLSSFCQGVRQSSPPAVNGQPDPATQSLYRTFAPIVESHIASPEESEIVTGLSFLSALFQVDWLSASLIFQSEAVIASLKDIQDTEPSDVISRELASLLSQAGGHKACRAVVPPEFLPWLQTCARQTRNKALRAAAATAIIKLTRGSTADSAEVTVSPQPYSEDADEVLVRLMKELVIDGEKASIADAVEGLAYLSVDPVVKESLAADTDFLKRLFSLIPSRKGQSSSTLGRDDSSILYGVLVLILNLCIHRPRLSEEETQMDKLKRMAKAKAGTSDQAEDSKKEALEDTEHVRARGRELVRCGALDVVTTAVRHADTQGVRVTASKILLNLAEDNDNRGRILQSGGAKSLLSIIRKSPASSPPAPGQLPDVSSADLEAIQALAKLAITASPVQVFGPDSGAIYDIIRPFSLMVIIPSATLLQRFEAMMALTNISSHSAEAAARVASAEGLISKVEFLMLEDHTLIRRAATELMCNLLAGSDDVFERYTSAPGAKSKLHVLVALSDVDDLPTRLAASGALATLTGSPQACDALYQLEKEMHRVLRNFTQLIDPTVLQSTDGDQGGDAEVADPGLVHRGVVCIRNCLINLDEGSRKVLVEQEEVKVLGKALVNVLKASAGNAAVLRPTAEALKALMDAGMQMPTT